MQRCYLCIVTNKQTKSINIIKQKTMKATDETIKMMDKALYELCDNLNKELQYCYQFSKAEIRKMADRMRGACLLFNSMCEDYHYVTCITETNYARLNGIAITLRQMNN